MNKFDSLSMHLLEKIRDAHFSDSKYLETHIILELEKFKLSEDDDQLSINYAARLLQEQGLVELKIFLGGAPSAALITSEGLKLLSGEPKKACDTFLTINNFAQSEIGMINTGEIKVGGA